MRTPYIIALLLFVCSACAAAAPAPTGVRLPDGTVVDQPGATVTITTSTGPAPGGLTSSQTKAKGPGVTAGDASNIKDLNLAVPDVTTGADGEVAAVGGVSGFTFRAVTRSSAGVLYIAGIIAVLAGIAIGALLKRWDWGAYLLAAGGAFIGCGMVAEAYPWLPLLIVAVAGIVGAALLVYRIKSNGVSAIDFEKVKAEAVAAWKELDKSLADKIQRARTKAATSTDPMEMAKANAEIAELERERGIAASE